MQIEEIALLNTTLTRYDGAKVVYPNPKMNADMVVNLNRSGNRNESIKVSGILIVEEGALCRGYTMASVYVGVLIRVIRMSSCVATERVAPGQASIIINLEPYSRRLPGAAIPWQIFSIAAFPKHIHWNIHDYQHSNSSACTTSIRD